MRLLNSILIAALAVLGACNVQHDANDITPRSASVALAGSMQSPDKLGKAMTTCTVKQGGPEVQVTFVADAPGGGVQSWRLTANAVASPIELTECYRDLFLSMGFLDWTPGETGGSADTGSDSGSGGT